MSEAYQWIEAVLRDEQPNLHTINQDSGLDSIWNKALGNGVVSLIHDKLFNTQCWDNLTEDFRNQTLEYVRNEIATELLFQHVLTLLLEELDKFRVRAILIKGTPLAYNLYPRAYLRTRFDTDLLFLDYKMAEKAWNILQKNGFKRRNTISGKFVSHQFTCFKSEASGNTHHLDIHWRVNNHHFLASRLTYPEIESKSVPVPTLSPLAQTLCMEHALLLACLHRTAHIPDGLSTRLIWLYDIHLISQVLSDSQWDVFTQSAIDKSICNICMDALTATKNAFATVIPNEVLSQLENKRAKDTMIFTSNTSRLQMEVKNFQALPGITQRLGLFLEHLFPNPDYMEDKYNIKNKIFLPIFYAARIFTGIFKLILK